MGGRQNTERFGTRRSLRVATLVALCFWLLVTVALALEAILQTVSLSLTTLLGLLFFDLLFLGATLYYHHRRIIVDHDGVVVTGVYSFREYPWHDVIEVKPDPGGFPGYEVQTRQGTFGLLPFEMPGIGRLLGWFERNSNRRSPPAERPEPMEHDKEEAITRSQHRRRAGRRRRARR